MEISEIKIKFNELEKNDETIEIRGRVKSIRRMKNYFFADLIDKGHKIQIMSNERKDLKEGDFIIAYGKLKLTSKGERTFKIERMSVKANWKHKISYKNIEGIKTKNLLKATSENKYNRTLCAFIVRKAIRKYYQENNFLEVQTEILTNKFNGGSSFPVKSNYLNKKLGYNRSTFEEQMQILIAQGHQRIFQIGSIFRSSRELTFIESYSSQESFIDGEKQIIDLMSNIAYELLEKFECNNKKELEKIKKKEWIKVDFFEEAEKIIGIDKADKLRNEEEIIETGREIFGNIIETQEKLADTLGNIIAQSYKGPIIIRSFPKWSSPIYSNKDKTTLHRAKGYFGSKEGGFEYGMQENSLEEFKKKVKKQRELWDKHKINHEEEGELIEVIKTGVPLTFGFGFNPDRIGDLAVKNSGVGLYY